MFFVQINDTQTLIISNAVKAELVPELEGVKFESYSGKVVAFYRTAEIKGFYNGSDTAGTLIQKHPFSGCHL